MQQPCWAPLPLVVGEHGWMQVTSSLEGTKRALLHAAHDGCRIASGDKACSTGTPLACACCGVVQPQPAWPPLIPTADQRAGHPGGVQLLLRAFPKHALHLPLSGMHTNAARCGTPDIHLWSAVVGLGAPRPAPGLHV
jgi:hypothetical protein